MEERIKIHVGLDVHKDRISVAAAEPGKPWQSANDESFNGKLRREMHDAFARERLPLLCEQSSATSASPGSLRWWRMPSSLFLLWRRITNPGEMKCYNGC